MIYKTIKDSIRAKNNALSLLLDLKAQCQNCKYCDIYHSVYKIPKGQISNSDRYSRWSKNKMREDIHYFCKAKKHDVLKFAQCKKFDFRH